MVVDQSAPRYIVVSGGVISGVGKGVIAASLAKILKEHGYSVTLIKIDPYINYDAGTLRPTEHGEVWVTADGGEIDQDLGNYERFINADIPKKNSITTGQIYKAVIDRERRGGYLGQTVQFIPHIIDEIVARITSASCGYDFAIVEIGGTVGDYENSPFLHAFKAVELKQGRERIAHVLVTYFPIPAHINEMKSRPTRQALAHLGEHGIVPQLIICRASAALDETRKEKIEEFSYIPKECIISAPDVTTIYHVPLDLERQNVGNQLLSHFRMRSLTEPSWDIWRTAVTLVTSAPHELVIGIVGKYLHSGDYAPTDSYMSIDHALIHAGIMHNVRIKRVWIDAQLLDSYETASRHLHSLDGLIIPGGFGVQGVEGKIAAIEYARRNQLPFLGICYGLQLAVVEYARHICGLTHAHTTEVWPETPDPVVTILHDQVQHVHENNYGASMRLGAYTAEIVPGSRVYSLYEKAGRLTHHDNRAYATERHRHRYEVNPAYSAQLAQAGLTFSGFYKQAPDRALVEYIELDDHPFFIATQAHPEFTSRFENPNPLFSGFVSAALHKSSVSTKG